MKCSNTPKIIGFWCWIGYAYTKCSQEFKWFGPFSYPDHLKTSAAVFTINQEGCSVELVVPGEDLRCFLFLLALLRMCAMFVQFKPDYTSPPAMFQINGLPVSFSNSVRRRRKSSCNFMTSRW